MVAGERGGTPVVMPSFSRGGLRRPRADDGMCRQGTSVSLPCAPRSFAICACRLLERELLAELDVEVPGRDERERDGQRLGPPRRLLGRERHGGSAAEG